VLSQAGLPKVERPHRPSLIDPYLPFVLQSLAQYPSLTASRLYAMVRERGYRGGEDHFRHLIAHHRPRPQPEAYLCLRTLPGEQAQTGLGPFRQAHRRAHGAVYQRWTDAQRGQVVCLRNAACVSVFFAAAIALMSSMSTTPFRSTSQGSAPTTTVTLKLALALLPAASVAVQVTTVVPTAKVLPESGHRWVSGHRLPHPWLWSRR
jgi:hypothetical protein